MQRFLLLLLASVLVATWCLAPVQAQPKKQKQPPWPPSPHVAPTDPLSPADQLKATSLPPGFEMQLVASEPDIKKPINIAFDAKGRLWVTTSPEYPFPPKGEKTADAVKILEDFGPDGKARKITTFAENLSIPIGVLPLGAGNKAIIFSIPNVWLMEDTDGDGKADKKTILLKEYGYQDTHGLTGEFMQGFDGWIYACHGFANNSTVTGTDGSTIQMHSGNVYRFKPDGSKLEFFTHGQVNPFGLAFDSLGNLYSTDCHSQPIYQLLRGAWYPSFAKPHDGLGFGPPMMTHNHGSTALCGIANYQADHFPKEFHNNIFIGNVTSNVINRDSLKAFGSTLQALAEPNLVTSKDPWFRPVDIKLGPDGALYVADFYTRIIGHYEVPLTHPGRDNKHGRIWRIVYKGKDGTGQPKVYHGDLTKATSLVLVDGLAHRNLTVRLMCTHQLVERGGKEGIDFVLKRMKNGNPFVRIHGLWVLERQGALPDDVLKAAIQDENLGARVHALKILAERATWTAEQRQLTLDALKDSNAFVQRAAVQALGSHPEFSNVPKLLSCRATVPAEDTHLIHVVRMAIRDHLKQEKILKAYCNLSLAAKDIAALADGLPSIPTELAAEFLVKNLNALADEPKFLTYTKHIARHGDKSAQSKLNSFGKDRFATNPLMQVAMLKSIHQGLQERGAGLDIATQNWAEDVTAKLVSSKNGAELQAGAELAGLLKIQAAQPALLEVLKDKDRPEPQRSQAALALAKINPKKSAPVLGKILIDDTHPMPLRETAARALAESNVAEGRAELVKSLPFAQAKLQKVIAVNLAGSKQGAEQLLDAVAKGKASPFLLQEKAVEQLLQKSGVPNLGKKLADLTKGLPPANAKLLQLLQKSSTGFAKAKADPKLGAAVFQKSCAACHAINNQGGKIAPQLDGIGHRGVDRLLEDILDPNRNVDQEFRATTLVLKNGKIFNGLFIRQEGETLILADGEGKEQRFDKKEVDERVVSQMSPMPANLGEQISEPDLYHLLAFLLEQKAEIKPKK
jgi:putative heme-binding domain-containing protein